MGVHDLATNAVKYGFGSQLIERNMAHDIGDRAKIEYRAEGVVYSLTGTLDSVGKPVGDTKVGVA